MGKRFLDQYSLLHFAVGVVAYFFGIGWMNWLIIHTLFELIENTPIGMDVINSSFSFWPGGKIEPDSCVNSIGDTLSAMLGWWVAYQVNKIATDNY